MTNLFIMHGRLCKDVTSNDIKKADGTASKIATTDIAIDRGYKDKDGKSQSDFFTIKAFDRQADMLIKYCGKGKELIVKGIIQNHNYQNKEGKTVYTNEFIVKDVEFCGKKEDTPSPNPTSTPNANPVVESKNTSDVNNIPDDDLPF